MPLLTQFQTFFISTFGEASVCAELNQFLKSHRIINMEKTFINGDRGTGWAVLVEFANQDSLTMHSGSTSKIDYREILSEKEFARFDALRKLRKTEAERLGIPVYGVFTNEQLAEMAKSPPKKISDLQKIKNVGEGRVKQFGEVFFNAILNMKDAEPAKTDEKKSSASSDSTQPEIF